MLYMLAGIASPPPAGSPRTKTRARRHAEKLGGPDRPALGDKGLAAALLRSQGRRASGA